MAQAALAVGPALSALGGATTVSTGLAVAGTIMSVMSANAQADFETQQAQEAADVAAENARQARIAGQSDAQDADLEAQAVLATIEARQGATGFTVTSPSFARVQDRNRVNADVNRERIIEDSERQAESAMNQSEAYASTAANSSSSRRLNLLSGAIQVGTDLISGADLTNKNRQTTVDRNRVAV